MDVGLGIVYAWVLAVTPGMNSGRKPTYRTQAP